MHWYVLHVRTGTERKVADGLAGLGREAFLPLRKRAWGFGYNTRLIERPLFPGYLFGRMDLETDWLPALKITA